MFPQNNHTLVSKSALRSWRSLLWIACALVTASVHAQLTVNNAVPVTAIDPAGGATISYQNPNWSTSFTNYTGEVFSAVTAATMGTTPGANVLNFETANGFPAATQSLTSSGTAFSASNTIAPFAIANALATINTSTGYSIGVQYATFNSHNNILGVPNATPGVFLVHDRTANDTMTSGTQGLVAGEAFGTDPGGTLLTFGRNLSQFGVVLNANSLGTTDVIALFDSNGVLMAKYTIGIAVGHPLYFGVKSPTSLIRSVWVGQSTATNGLILDDVAFVPAPAPGQAPIDFTFNGSAGLTGWSHTSSATLTTNPTYLAITANNSWDSKIYRGISLQAGTYTLTGTGSGSNIVQISTSLSNSPYVQLNLGQASGWRTDSTTFTAPGGTLYLMVKVNGATGTANIEFLDISATPTTPYTINTTALQTQKNTLSLVRGMDSTWNSSVVLGSAYFTELKSWGCNVVRLQLHPVTYAGSQAFWTAWPNYLSGTIQNIQQAQAAGLKVVIDLHEMPLIESGGANPWTDPALGNQFALVWQSIAQAVVSNNLTSAVWGYELLNEPIDTAQLPNVPRQWLPMAKNLVNTIRTIDPNTWIIYDVGPGGDFGGFTNLTPLPDASSRIIYSAHFYNPESFCLQGIPNTGYPQGAHYSSTTTNLATYLAPADTFQAAWPVPIYIGEFSVARWSPIPDSKNWLTDIVALLEARGWSWCYFAWEEYNAWDLNRDSSFTPTNPPAYLPDTNRTDRGTVIYNALQKNNSP
ncbi:glycoside hydrolase family 5 [Chthoniobacter flavus Ellin428]|uniref:Glycoside hydrolase family 5 n=1 Tax=Chthoniobacter flavus Ellin428 TaxID=497964 RepID=B4DB39_9BACT|nr:glycoside hydrolase family 5 [Chthoniobacter flavus Ellin428]TCO90265.1 aryl-phospho-beta-D-glucosidase BglC (GH1 family) [Chthoniobacter flavus]